MFRHLRQLKRENEAMREALGWYAARSTWRRSAKNPKGTPRRWEKSPAAHDRGERALRVILRVEEERVRVSLFARLRSMTAKRPAPPRVINVPAPLALTAPMPKASPCIDQPISSTESSTTELPTGAKSGRTDGSADTPAETP